MLPGLRPRAARDRALARLHAAGQPDGADRHACRASSRGFRPTCCIAAIATWCSSAWRSIRSSSSRRNIPTPAAPPNCCATISPTCSARAPPCSASARTISSSTSAPTTARCCRTSRRRASACSASSRPTSATSPTSRGIPTRKRYFGVEVAREVQREHGAASVVTAANCFAHIEDVHAIVDGIVEMLSAERRLHFRIALSHRAARHAAIRHRLSRAPALLFAGEP